jgi:hypothetical protein
MRHLCFCEVLPKEEQMLYLQTFPRISDVCRGNMAIRGRHVQTRSRAFPSLHAAVKHKHSPSVWQEGTSAVSLCGCNDSNHRIHDNLRRRWSGPRKRRRVGNRGIGIAPNVAGASSLPNHAKRREKVRSVSAGLKTILDPATAVVTRAIVHNSSATCD